ncbi:MAG: AAA family ATPase [Clostridiaceae bacterium]|nr:AAA family ATPase [Clostridiaceae bacterium]
MSVKINSLELENVKRVRAVKLEPSANGLTVIGGNNDEGKTSVLDSIAWALGGNRFKPDSPQNKDSVIPPRMRLELSNGLVVERKGKNSDLYVTDPSGEKAGQTLLDSFVEVLAIDLPRFMNANNKEKAETLLQIIGVGEELEKLDREEQSLYNKRHTLGQIAEQKDKFAKEQAYYPDAPEEYISASELIKEQQEILARNGMNQKHREEKDRLEVQLNRINDDITSIKAEIKRLEEHLTEKSKSKQELLNKLKEATKTVEQLQDESTAEIEESIENIEEINIKVRANIDKANAKSEAEKYKAEYEELTEKIEAVRQAKRDLLEGADMPLPELSVQDGELTYKGFTWDGMSGSDQLKVATAIVKSLKPDCGFVLLDKLEQFDSTKLQEFGEWLEQEGMQAIATRVSTGEECQIIISDGLVVKENKTEWVKGVY